MSRARDLADGTFSGAFSQALIEDLQTRLAALETP